MCLRAQSGELPVEECEWWTLIQEVDEDEKRAMCQLASPTKHAHKKNHKRRKNG
jgi:poly(A) polymerase